MVAFRKSKPTSSIRTHSAQYAEWSYDKSTGSYIGVFTPEKFGGAIVLDPDDIGHHSNETQKWLQKHNIKFTSGINESAHTTITISPAIENVFRFESTALFKKLLRIEGTSDSKTTLKSNIMTILQEQTHSQFTNNVDGEISKRISGYPWQTNEDGLIRAKFTDPNIAQETALFLSSKNLITRDQYEKICAEAVYSITNDHRMEFTIEINPDKSGDFCKLFPQAGTVQVMTR